MSLSGNAEPHSPVYREDPARFDGRCPPSMESAVTIRPSIRKVELQDLRAVASVHEAAFPDSLLTALGPEAVRRYYEWQLVGPHDVVALAVWSRETAIGFCIGGTFRGALSGYLRRNRWFLLGQLAQRPWLLANPRFLKQLPLPRRRSTTATAVSSLAASSFGILAIGVRPDYQGLGVGRMLMDESEKFAARLGFDTMYLTVASENLQAIRFYERLGWIKEAPDGEWRGSMIKPVHRDRPDSACT